MRPTRDLWVVGGLIATLSTFAVVFARPDLLVGSALIGGWALSRQYAFRRGVLTALSTTTVEQEPGVRAGYVDESVPATLSVRASEAVPVTLSARAGVPPGARLENPLTATIGPGEPFSGRSATVSESVTWPIAGRHRFEPARVVTADRYFTQEVTLGETPTVTVEPRDPGTVHIGAGGEQVVPRLGAHTGGLLGNALESAEIREYQPGDEIKRIDWNATARLAAPHVQEFEGEADRPTVLAIDRRAALETGPPGETKLDYLREAALAITASARELGDPIGLVTLDDDGVQRALALASSPTGYEHVRRHLFDLGTVGPGVGASATSSHGRIGTAASTRLRSRLDADADDAAAERFLETLRPFTRRRGGDRHAPASFVGGLQSFLTRQDRRSLVVLCTDDSAPRTLWESVRTVREQGHRALVLVTPTVLFEPGGLADLETAYERYVDFERLRRELDRMAGVRVLEVAPDARLQTVLAAGETRRAEARQ